MNGCSDCPAGTYNPYAGYHDCVSCADGFYQPDSGQTNCLQCPYPYSTREIKAVECSAFCLCFNSFIVQGCLYFLGLCFLVGIMFSGVNWNRQARCPYCIIEILQHENSPNGCFSKTFINFMRLKPVAMLALFGPAALDSITNALYVMGQKFYSKTLFIVAAVCLAQNMLVLMIKLIAIGARPLLPFEERMIKRFWLLSTSYRFDEINEANRDMCLPYLSINGFVLFKSWTEKQHIYTNFILDLIGLAFFYILQLLFFVSVVISWPIFILALLTMGSILQMCKLMSVGCVWNLWIFLWSGDCNLQVPSNSNDLTELTSDSIDTEDLNHSIYYHAFFESLPHLIIQSVNSSLLRQFDSIAALSIAVSGNQLISALFPLMFYKCRRDFAHRNMVDIPVRVPFTDITLPPKKKRDDINCWTNIWKYFRCVANPEPRIYNELDYGN